MSTTGTSTTTTPTTTTTSSGSTSSLEDPLVDPLATSSVEAPSKRTKKGTELGKLSWEGALGKFLGGKAYAALSEHLTEGALSDYAKKGVDGAMGTLKDWLKTQVDPDDAAIAAKFTTELGKELKKLSKEFLSAEGTGAAEAIASFVDKNPELLVAAALAGAAAFVLTNQPIPEIPISAGLGGGTLGVKVGLDGGMMDLFKSFDIALKSLEASYKWSGGEVKGTYSTEDIEDKNKTVTKGDLGLTLGKGYGKVFGEHEEFDLGGSKSKFGLTGGYKGDKLSLSGGLAHTMGTDIDPLTTMMLDGRYKDDGFSVGGSAMMGSDGRHKFSGDFTKQLNDNTSIYGSGYHERMPGLGGDMSTSAGAKLGMKYQKDRFKAGGFLGVDHKKGVTSPSLGVSLGYSF